PTAAPPAAPRIPPLAALSAPAHPPRTIATSPAALARATTRVTTCATSLGTPPRASDPVSPVYYPDPARPLASPRGTPRSAALTPGRRRLFTRGAGGESRKSQRHASPGAGPVRRPRAPVACAGPRLRVPAERAGTFSCARSAPWGGSRLPRRPRQVRWSVHPLCSSGFAPRRDPAPGAPSPPSRALPTPACQGRTGNDPDDDAGPDLRGGAPAPGSPPALRKRAGRCPLAGRRHAT